MKKNYCIIGTSAAGIGAMSSILRADSSAAITLVSDEPYLPYNKCHLIDVLLTSKTPDQLYTRAISFFEQQPNVQIVHARVEHIDTSAQRLALSTGQQLAYDALCIATGSRARTVEIEGICSKGVFHFHTMTDLHAIEQYLTQQVLKRAVVIGAGFTGLEVADALSRYSIETTVLDMQTRVLSATLDVHAAAFVQQRMRKQGVSFVGGKRVVALEALHNQVHAVICDDGITFAADMVVIALGVVPNTALALSAGITTNVLGVTVNTYLQTSAPQVWAAGDVVAVPNVMTGQLMRSCMWHDAVAQGGIVGKNMSGLQQPYAGITWWATSAFFDLEVMLAGDVRAATALMNGTDYRAWQLQDNKLQGFALLGRVDKISDLKRLYMTGAPCTVQMIEQLLQ